MAVAVARFKNPLLNLARWYADHVWLVFPCAWAMQAQDRWVCSCRERANCARPAKHPLGRLAPRGLRDASTHRGQVDYWWAGQCPYANIGLVTGAGSGIWVLDVDAGKDGFGSLEQLAKDVGGLPDTLQADTGGGGLHLYFRHPGRKVVTRTSSLGPGLDVRGDGGYVLAPPSRHVSGRRYAWSRSMQPAVAPAALLERVMAPPEPVQLPPAPAPKYGAQGEVRERARRYLGKLPPSISGSGGHSAAFKAAMALVKGFELPLGDALELLESDFNPRCQPRWSRGELVHKVQSAAALKCASGYLLTRGLSQGTWFGR